MTRSVAFAGVALVLAACGGEKQTATGVPEPTVLVTDSLGRVYDLAPSPDGTRLLYMQTVAGKAHLFVAAADGSNPVEITHGVWDRNPFWSPDGKWIAYLGEDPDYDLFVIASDGSGERKQLTSGRGTDVPRGWVKDGSAILFGRSGLGDDQTMLISREGGEARRLGPDMRGNQHGNYSPDGSLYGFDIHQGGGDATVWVQDTSGGAPKQLTDENLENVPGGYLWSPDGTRIVYTSRRTGTRDIWTVDVRTKQRVQVTTDVRDDYNGRWSPDSKWIAFLSDRGGQTDLWIAPSSGGKAVRVTNDISLESPARWTPDGSALYFLSGRTGAELQMVPVSGGTARTVARLDGYQIQSASLSPDGGTIVFDSDRSGNPDVWSVPVAGGEPTPLAVSPTVDGSPSFSPDGSQILFFSDRAGSQDLYVMPAAGGAPRRLTELAGAVGTEPVWSPDGRTVAFSSSADTPTGDLWTVPAAGGTPTRLTRNDSRPTAISWSPDSKQIFFRGEIAGKSDLYRIPATGGTPTGLGANPMIGAGTELAPDGRNIAFTTFDKGWAFINLMPTAGGPPRRLTKDTSTVYDRVGLWSRDGTYLVGIRLDFAANRDMNDLMKMPLDGGPTQMITSTRDADEQPVAFTKDGREILTILRWGSTRILRVPVADLLKAPAPQ